MNNSSQTPIRLYIVDDHKIVRAGLRQLLEDAPDIQVVGEAASGAQALADAAKTNPSVILLDLRLPDQPGFEICRQFKRLHSRIRILILTSYMDDNSILESVASGIDGYLLKEIDGPDLALAIRQVAAGQPSLDPRVARRMMDQIKPPVNPLLRLSFQERRLVALIAEGKTNKDIGFELGLSEKTVRNYLTAAMQKLNIKRRSEAAVIHERFG